MRVCNRLFEYSFVGYVMKNDTQAAIEALDSLLPTLLDVADGWPKETCDKFQSIIITIHAALHSKPVDVEGLPKGKFHDLLWDKLSSEEDHKRLRQKCSLHDMRCIIRDAYGVADHLHAKGYLNIPEDKP